MDLATSIVEMAMWVCSLIKKKKEKKKFLQMYGVAIQATLIDAENEQQKKEMGKDW